MKPRGPRFSQVHIEQDFEGTLVLEKLASIDQVDYGVNLRRGFYK